MSAADSSSRLDSEWAALSALRELIQLATRGDSSSGTYRQALALGEQILPELFGEDSLLRRAQESNLAREYRQKAEAKTRQEGKAVTAETLLRESIAEYTGLLEEARNKQRTDRLARRITLLQRALDEIAHTAHSENQLIFRDVYNVDRQLPVLNLGRGYKDLRLNREHVLRLRVLHPDHPEHITGADVIYERHEPSMERANVLAVQYKIWEDRVLSLTDDRLQKQLSRMTVVPSSLLRIPVDARY